jgi:SAM-dependent methyltransferase
MGISRAFIKLLMREGNNEKFYGNLLTIGKQDIFFATSRNLKKWADGVDFQLKPGIKLPPKGLITGTDLFTSLGFDSVDSMDCNDYEQCTIIHDLNNDVPQSLHGKYDLIIDSGSSEHIFNLPKVLENYNRMLRVGGRIIHSLPSSNHVDHGFYMFSPTVFYDYYSANRWSIIESLFFRYSRQHFIKLWDIYKYTSGCLDKYSFGCLDGMWGVFFVLKKTEDSTFNASVQQGSCVNGWLAKTNTETSVIANKFNWKKIPSKLPESAKSVLRFLYYKIFLTRTPKFNLKPVARY